MRSRIRRKPSGIPTPREIYEHLDRYVVGQERAKRVVAIAAHNHLKRCRVNAEGGRKDLLRKSNILMAGPTGCGKTHLARKLAELLEVPFVVVDATEYTEAGYYGKDVEVMVAELLFAANHSIEETERGVIFVDEVDKVARRSHGARTGAGSRDIGGEGVQQGMLKLLEGRKIFVPLNVTQHWNKHDFVQVDTSDILFICAGTFSDIDLYAGSSRPIGFEGGEAGEGGPARRRRRRIGAKDLLDYGIIAEFLGRLPVHVELEELEEGDLKRILVEPPDSLVREYRELLSLDGVSLEITDSALDEIVRCAVARRVGARGLRSIMEEVCHDLLFEAPELARGRAVLDGETVRARLEALDGTDLTG
jgi:ATP-dependent Clp protease ATP-binding subunit ClpX